ncbi:hypothetical protein NESM_000307300 [Novymonas esmeraldas]|uniref:Uncharacterized protein n=1 Tax=Novymonas esmeraldas TaxID=1808958 RepID=A0AAW0EJY1_9TRYP
MWLCSGATAAAAAPPPRVLTDRSLSPHPLRRSPSPRTALYAVLLAALLCCSGCCGDRGGADGRESAAAGVRAVASATRGVAPLAVTDDTSAYQVSPLFALADVRLDVVISGVRSGDVVQLWEGADACAATISSGVQTEGAHGTAAVLARRTVSSGATSVTLGVPACCTFARTVSVCIQSASSAASATAAAASGSGGGGGGLVHAANVELSTLSQSPSQVVLPSCPTAAAAVAAATAVRLTIAPGAMRPSAGGATAPAWAVLPPFCADASCRSTESSSASDGADVDVAAVASLVEVLRRSFAYWEIPNTLFGFATSASPTCVPASESYGNPAFLQANISVLYRADVGRYWAYVDVALPSAMAGLAAPITTAALRTCVAPISSATISSVAGGEYAGHTSAGVLTVTVDSGGAGCGGTSSSSHSLSHSGSGVSSSTSSSSTSSSTSSSSSSTSSSSTSSSSTSSSSTSSGSSSSSATSSGGSGSLPPVPPPTSSSSSSHGDGSSSSDDGVFALQPYPTSAVKGQVIVMELRRPASAAVSPRALAAAPAPRAVSGTQEQRPLIAVMARSATCAEWLTLPVRLGDEADAWQSRLTIPACGTASPGDASSSSSSGGDGDAELEALRRGGTYVPTSEVEEALFCVAQIPASAPATGTSGGGGEGGSAALTWRALGTVALLALYDCATGEAVAIATSTIGAATRLVTAADYGVRATATNSMPWLSMSGGTAGCTAEAASASFTAVQRALQSQGYLTPEGASPPRPAPVRFFVCVLSPDGTLAYTTAAPTLTIDSFDLRPRVAVWGVPQGYALAPRGAVPAPAQTYMTFTAAAAEATQQPFTTRVAVAATASGNSSALVLLGDGLDSDGVFMTESMIGVYRLTTFGLAIEAAPPVLTVTSAYVPIASVLVLRPPTVSFVSYSLNSSSSSSSTAAPGPEVQLPPRSPSRVPAGARVCATTYVPGDLYSQVPGQDRVDDAYAAYRAYYYDSYEEVEEGSASSVSSSSGREGSDWRERRGMYLLATTPAAWHASQASRGSLCVPESGSSATPRVTSPVAQVEEGDDHAVCFHTEELGTGGPGALYVLCAGTPAGDVQVPAALLTMTPATVAVTPTVLVAGATTLVHVEALPDTAFAVVPSSSSSLASSPSVAAAVVAAAAEDAATRAGGDGDDGVCARLGDGLESEYLRLWPRFTTNASGYGWVTLVGATNAALPAGTYVLCYWWPDLGTAAAAAASSHAQVTGSWEATSTSLSVRAPVHYSLSSAAVVAPMTSILGLRQDLSTDALLPGFFATDACTSPVSEAAVSWARVPVAADTTPGLAATSATRYDTTLIEVSAAAPLDSPVFLCARVAANNSVVAVPPRGLRLAAQPLLLPYSSASAALPTCSEILLFFGNSTGLYSGSYTRNVGETLVRAPETNSTAMAAILAASTGNASAAARVAVVLSTGPCCASAAGIDTYGVWVRAGAMGYVINDTTQREAARGWSGGGGGGGAVDPAGDVRLPWTACMVVVSGDGPLAASAAQCTEVGRIWVTTADSQCAATRGSGSSSADVAVASPASTRFAAAAAAATYTPASSMENGILPLLVSLSATRVNVMQPAALATGYSRAAWLVIVAGAVLCGAYAVLAPLLVVAVTCVVVRRRRWRCLRRAAAALHDGSIGAATTQREAKVPATPTEDAKRRLSVRRGSDGWRASLRSAAAADDYVDVDAVELPAPVLLRTAASTSALGGLPARDTASSGRSMQFHPSEEDEEDGGWTPASASTPPPPPERIEAVETADQSVDVDDSLTPPAATSATAAGPAAVASSAPQSAQASATRANGLFAASTPAVRERVLAPVRVSHGDSGAGENLQPPAPVLQRAASAAVAASPAERRVADDVTASPAVVQETPRAAAVPGPAASHVAPRDAAGASRAAPRPLATASLAVAAVAVANAAPTTPLPNHSPTVTRESPAPVPSLAALAIVAAPSPPPLLTVAQLQAAEAAARRTLERAEAAEVLAALEWEQRAWRRLMRGEGVRLQSLLMNDPYWAPRLAELEAVNGSAMAAAQHGGSDDVTAENDDDDDSCLLTTRSDSVVLFPLPRAPNGDGVCPSPSRTDRSVDGGAASTSPSVAGAATSARFADPNSPAPLPGSSVVGDTLHPHTRLPAPPANNLQVPRSAGRRMESAATATVMPRLPPPPPPAVVDVDDGGRSPGSSADGAVVGADGGRRARHRTGAAPPDTP